MTNGKTYKTRSTYGEEGSVMTLEVDPISHPAWTGSGSSVLNEKAGRVAAFNQKFGKIGSPKKKEESGDAK